MSTSTVVCAASTVLLSIMLLGCSSSPATGDPAAPRVVQDKTPSWMKYQVTGSRIARRTDGRGQPISADIVKSTSPYGLALLPGVTVNSRGY